MEVKWNNFKNAFTEKYKIEKHSSAFPFQSELIAREAKEEEEKKL